MCVADVFCRIKYKVYKLTIKIKVYRGYKLYLYERYAHDTRARNKHDTLARQLQDLVFCHRSAPFARTVAQLLCCPRCIIFRRCGGGCRLDAC